MTIVPALQGCDVPIPGTTWALAAGPDAIGVALGMRHSSIDVDIETFGLGALSWSIKCVTISDGHTAAVLDPRDPKQHEVIARVIADTPELVFYSSPFDVPILYNNKLLRIQDVAKVVDPLIWARMVEPDSFVQKSLEAVGDRYGVLAKGKPISQTFKELGISKAEGFHKFDINVVSYLYGAALDGLVTHHVRPLLRAAAKKMLATNPYTGFRIAGSELEHMLEREQIVNRVLLRRACLGIRVDFDFAAEYRSHNQAQIDIEEAQLKELGIKPGDGGSLLKWMDGYGLIGPDHPRTPTGKLQATAAVLEDLSHPIASIFVSHKRKVKVDRDYLAKMEELSKPTGGRIHPSTNILAAVTGRMSVSNPPLQQMPPAARGIFIPDEGRKFVSIDYAQVEPFLVANVAGDLGVLKGYESGESDLYTDLAAFAEARGTPMPRKIAKVVLLAQLYGEGMGKLTKDLGLDPGALVEREDGTWTHTYEEARAIQAQIFEVMPQTEKLIKNLRDASNRNRAMTSISGRVIPVPVYVNKKTGQKTDVAGYKGVNYFCIDPSTPVLTADLQHISAKYISVGDRLVGFDEYPVEGDSGAVTRWGKPREARHLRTAVVEDVRRVVKETVRVMLSDGRQVVCSTDHLWLTRQVNRPKDQPRLMWTEAANLTTKDELLSLGQPWDYDPSRTAGWLAGMYDGEGCMMTKLGSRRVSRLIFAQNPGPIMDRFKSEMTSRGYKFQVQAPHPSSTSPCELVNVTGVREVMRVLGTLRPVRFAPRYEDVYEGFSITGGLTESVRVVAVEALGDRETISIQTSTHTLVANGILSHNCQGSAYDMLAEAIVAVEKAGLGDAVYLAVHDELIIDSEAAHDVDKVMRQPCDALVRASGRVPKVQTEMSEPTDRWTK